MRQKIANIPSYFTQDFEKCDRQELTKYLIHYTNSFSGTEMHIDASSLDNVLTTLSDAVLITFRELNHVSIICEYDAFDINHEEYLKFLEYLSSPEVVKLTIKYPMLRKNS